MLSLLYSLLDPSDEEETAGLDVQDVLELARQEGILRDLESITDSLKEKPPKYYCTVVEMSRQQPVRLVDHQMALKNKGFGGAVCVCVCESRSDTLSTRGLDLVSKSQCPSLGI